MKKEIVEDLDKIAFSLEAYLQYKYNFALKMAEWYKNSGRIKNIRISEIPDERFRVLENGDGEIFIKMPDGIELSFLIPKGHWGWNNTNN